MSNDFWRPNSRWTKNVPDKNNSNLPFCKVTNPGEQILQQFLMDIEDGRVPGAKVEMNGEASAELGRRILRAFLDINYRNMVIYSTCSQHHWVEPQQGDFNQWRIQNNEDRAWYNDDDDENDSDIPF